MPTEISGTTGISQIQDGTVSTADIADDAITDVKIAAVASSKLTGTISSARVAANTIDSSHITSGAIDDAHLSTGITASKLTGALPAIDGSSLTGITTDTTQLENNIAMLGFYRATDHSKEKYNLVDQIIDEYVDASGIDAGNSTNEEITGGYVRGGVVGSSTGATGGDQISAYGSTTLHKFLSNGTFTPLNAGNIHVLLVGGGGTGGNNIGGGGAGGELEENTSLAVTAQTYTIVVGAGGIHTSHPNNYSANGASTWAGQNSTGFGITAYGGNHGAPGDNRTPYGNSGGHRGGRGAGNRAASSSYTGNDGGSGGNNSGGGGAGAGAVGGSAPNNDDGGNGGAGTQNNIDGNNYYYGGGGGGSGRHRDNSSYDGGDGGIGGGAGGCGGGTSTGGGSAINSGGNVGFGGGNGGNGGDNSGGGGGGSGVSGGSKGGEGGSGIIIVKYTTSTQLANDPANLTLLSTANTASAVPTTGDIVMLIHDQAGTATLNTDIKAYVSRNGGTTYTQGTLTDEGDWGTNKKILAFHDLDISGQSSGTSMKYKITTHNQSASKETRIHATSLAWA